MIHKFLLLSFIFCNFLSLAQNYEGQILHRKTHQPIPFANIRYEEYHGVISDIDGKYVFETHGADSAIVSYVGFVSQKVKLVEGEFQKIFLEEKVFDLNEVVITPGINPALRIVEKLIENKELHNPLNYNRYKLKAYDKLVLTVHEDSLAKYEEKLKTDTSFRKMKAFFDKQYMFLLENVTQVNYEKPGNKQEEVLSTRMSGFQSPIFVFILSQLQSNSFYNSRIEIAGTSYINPFNKGSASKYWFRLEDTLYSPTKDTSFIISYRPRKGINFEGLKGVATISTNGWAFENITAEPAKANEKGVNIVIEQNYDLVADKYWFPSQLNTTLFLGNVQANGIPMIGRGKRYLFDIEVNGSQMDRFNPSIALKYAEDAYDTSNMAMTKYRRIPFTAKDMETYRVIDSVSKAENLEKKIKGFGALLDGEIKWGKFSIPMSRLLDENRHEGWRFGMGIKTNNAFSKTIGLGGYVAYSLKDDEVKYGGNFDLYLDALKKNVLQILYQDDVLETGNHDFSDNLSIFNPETYRNFSLKRFDRTEMMSVSLKMRVLPFLQLTPFVSIEETDPLYDYAFADAGSADEFRFLESGLQMRLAWGERFVLMPNKEMSLGTPWPILMLRYQQGIDNENYGDYSYHRITAQINHEVKINLVGTFRYRLEAGYLDGEVPLMKLYHAKGSFKTPFYSPFSFVTMRNGEFYNEQFVSLFLSHSFNTLLMKTKYFAPEISIHHNMLFGKNDQMELHQEVEFSDTRKGYVESGLVLDNVLKIGFTGIGLSGFYRYGHYAHNDAGDNFVIRFTLRAALN